MVTGIDLKWRVISALIVIGLVAMVDFWSAALFFVSWVTIEELVSWRAQTRENEALREQARLLCDQMQKSADAFEKLEQMYGKYAEQQSALYNTVNRLQSIIDLTKKGEKADG